MHQDGASPACRPVAALGGDAEPAPRAPTNGHAPWPTPPTEMQRGVMQAELAGSLHPSQAPKWTQATLQGQYVNPMQNDHNKFSGLPPPNAQPNLTAQQMGAQCALQGELAPYGFNPQQAAPPINMAVNSAPPSDPNRCGSYERPVMATPLAMASMGPMGHTASTPQANGAHKRWTVTPEQLQRLEEVFEKVPYPDGALRQQLATEFNNGGTDINQRQVQIWFQNRRQRNTKAPGTS